LGRNPNFHGERFPTEGESKDQPLLIDAGRPLTFIDQAVYTLEKENIPAWNKFLQGYYDAGGIGSDQFDQAIRMNAAGESNLTEALQEKGMRLLTSVAPTTYYMGVNMLDTVVGGYSDSARKLRQALTIAIDQEESISIFNNGRGMAMQGPIPPGIFGYREGESGMNRFVYDWINGHPNRKSIGEAKRLLAEAGYPDGREAQSGKPLILYFDTAGAGPDDKAHFDWMRKQFAKINLQLVVRATDYNRFQDKMLQGTAQIFQWGWHADYPDPENFLFLLYSENAKVGKNGENAANYANPRFDGLFDLMRNMENGPDRLALIDQMIEIVRHDAPWISGFHPENFGLYHDWYQNIKQNAIAYNTLKYVKLDTAVRAKQRGLWNRPVRWPIILLGVTAAILFIPAIFAYRKRESSL
jgi:ABC-type transport system substrate-binding protein